jgi:hypothetical protein
MNLQPDLPEDKPVSREDSRRPKGRKASPKKKGQQETDSGFEGAWGDEEVESTGSFERNTELELLKLGQRLNDLERR